MTSSPLHLIANVFEREHQSLNGDWHVIVDPFENGYYDYRYQPLAQTYGSNQKPQGPGDHVEYDFDSSPTLKVPGDWNSQWPELRLYEGTVWYKTSFRGKRSTDRRQFLHFAAANYEAIVYVNGKLLGKHVGGFTAFEFEISDILVDGENTIIVKVDNQRRKDGVPTVNTDWNNFGGLTRDVLLVDVPRTFVKDYFVQLEHGSLDRIGGWVLLDGPQAAGQTIALRIRELGTNLSLQTDGSGRAAFSLHLEGQCSLELWSAEQPKRYSVEIAAAGDRVEEMVGFRSIATRGADILLNGKPVFLRGISIHEQAPERAGRATSEADARKLLGWAKELGCNFVRLAHYPHNPHTVRVAEELGLLVWSEVPVYWTIQWENPDTHANAERQITEMVQRDKNRAAVILWAVSNETPISEARNRFLRSLVATVRRLDPTRLLTAALERHYATDQRTAIVDDPLGQDLDVIGLNQYIGWYDGLPPKCDTVTWDVRYEKPLVFSELGADAKAGHHGPPDHRWTEEFQKDLYERQLRMMQKVRLWRGLSPWILTDFQSPRRPLPKIQDGYNRKGLVSDQGEKKQAFFVLQAFYRRVASDPNAGTSET